MLSPLEIALERIDVCRQTQAPRLDLSNLLLKEIPPSVFELVWLEELDLSIQYKRFIWLRGFIKALPPEITRLTRLLHLNLAGQRLSDLSPLQTLTQLQSLDCSKNQITDLSPLQALTQLQSLNCWNNQITDLRPLQALTQLQSLDCSRNQINDLSPLQALTQLQSLDCSENQINDLRPLQALTQLQYLDCSSNQITDLRPLQALTQLQYLDCSSNQITDLRPLQALTQLQYLDCWSNQITDLSPLKALKQLQSLDCSNNQITDLSPLQTLTQLQSLNCSSNKIADLSSLQTLTQLQLLDYSNNQITDLGPLQTLTQLQSLNCAGSQVKHLSPLQSFTQLQSLYCYSNKITSLSPLQSFTQLQSLYCSDNKITDLRPLQALTQLQSLYCWHNQIEDLSSLQALTQLQSLYCWHNQIEDLSPLQTLTQLKSLDCRGNQITDLSLLQSLEQLQSLHCGYNPIDDISPLVALPYLIELDCSRLKLPSLTFFGEQQFPLLSKITAHHCSVTDPHHIDQFIYERERILYLSGTKIDHLPSVILGSEYEDCYESLLHYYKALEQGCEWKLQLKIQFIGNGRVGKSSLAYTLQHQKAAPPQMPSTHGITIETCSPTPHSDAPITWQLWDFGGQEIYHATHRLFLSDDCLYILVWAEETEEQPDEINHPVSYWLEAIHDLAPHSPVILVKNQIDRSDKYPSAYPADFNSTMLGADQIRQAAKISALQYKNINSLRGMIHDVIEELQGRVCLKLPRSWLAVEEAINQLKLTQKTLSFDSFTTLCQQHQIDYAEWFAGYLHKTGVVFYQQGAFQDHMILDQNWIIEAVYKVFDRNAPYRQRLLKKGGRLSGFETQLIWQNTEESEREIYLNFMRDCHICYEVNRVWNIPFEEREYIIPAFLAEKNPTEKLWHYEPSKDWQYNVHYPFLHRSIIERLIIRLGETYKDNAQPWREGIYCETEWGQVSLVAQIPDKTQSNKGYLQFSLRGSDQERLLYALRKLVKEISPHSRYQEFLQKEPCTEPSPLPAFQEQDTMTSRLDSPIAKPAIQVFISYSKEDKEHRLELEKRLKNISRQFKVQAWTDAQLLAGGLVHEDIKEQLSKADLILLLISPDFMATDYCYEIELPLALERYQANQTIVIPIIVRDTPDWAEQAIKGFKLGDITALPTKGLPLTKWSHKDDFWSDVQLGLKARVKNLLATD